MAKKDQSDSIARRDFLRQSTCKALGITGVVNTLAHLRLTTAALAADAPLTGDYKALVVLFLFGGNDSNNMLVPTNQHPQRGTYETGRGILALPDDSLAKLNFPSASDQQFGLHPRMAAAQSIFNEGELAFVANVGTLAFPVTRQEYLSGSVPLPPQLFSHSDQQEQWQSSIPDRPFQSGWGGRAADLLNASYNASSEVSMSISLAGVNQLQVGTSGDVVQYAVGTNGAISLAGFGGNYGNAFDTAGNYRNSDTGRRLRTLDQVMRYTHENLMEENYNEVVRRARANEGIIGEAGAAAVASGVDFDAIFDNAKTRLGDQLKQIARLIAGRDCLGNRRQIFFCSAGGYDTHQDQLNSHGNLMEELGNALSAFNDAMKAAGTHDQVMTISHSDFTRTFTPNGDDPGSSGSDHGWGGHHFAMGGPVRGGQIYGTYPDLTVEGPDDTNGRRGRTIPTTSVEQFSAVPARWLGVESSALEAIFPNLRRFDDPFAVSSANLNFVNL